LDAAVRAIRGGGLRVLMDIGFWAPRWATTDPGPRARANIDPQAFGDYAAAVARRYSGAFTPPLDPVDTPAPPPTPDQSLVQSILQPLVPFPVPDPLGGVPPLTTPPPPPPPAPRAATTGSTDGGPQGP